MAYTLTEKLWYTADKSQVVSDGDPRAAFLLGPAGYVIDDDEAARLGLKGASSRPDKARPAPQNKGVSFEPEGKDSEGASSGGDDGGRRHDRLPDDFPAADLLARNGVTTYAELRAVEDLTALEGIGPTWAGRILQALSEENG